MITGASGVIGTHFIWSYTSYAIDEDTVIYAIHNRPLPIHLKHLKNINFLQGDLTDSSFLKSLPHADIIIHAATYSPPKLFMGDPIGTLKLNTSTVFELLDKLNDDGRFLFISSSEIYDGLNNPPFKETDIGITNTEHPRACYIEGKRCGETICLTSDKDVKIVRLGAVYGDGIRSSDSRVLYEFISQALTVGKITIKGGMDNVRSYCFASDAVNMMWNIISYGKQKIYNIGGDTHITIKELAILIAKLTDVFVISSNDGILDGAPTKVYLDMDRYNSEFGKYNYISLEEGLLKTIHWQKIG